MGALTPPPPMTDGSKKPVCQIGLTASTQIESIVSQPSKCLKFMTFRGGCFVIHVECKYLSEALETFITISFTKDDIR